MNADLERALTSMREERDALAALLAPLDAEDLAQAAPGGWTIGRTLQHVIESEHTYAKLLAFLCGRNTPEVEVAQGAPTGADAVLLLRATRDAVLAMVQGVDDDALYRLKRAGHEEYSPLSVLQNIASHDRDHGDQIGGVLSKAGVPRGPWAHPVANRDVIVRPGAATDAARLNEIYDHYIVHTAVTFDTEPWTLDQRRAWIAHYAPVGRHRLLVAERDGVVVGYASTSPFQPRAAYETTVEMSVVCAHHAVGQGVGQRLYEELFPAIRDEDIHVAMALITMPNKGSMALHERFGFEQAMLVREVGRKFGEWHDVLWMTRRMPFDQVPAT